MRILIADDHPLYLTAIQTLLERLLEESDVETVRSFDQAAAATRRGRVYDLLLLDYSMPGMNGAEGVRSMVKAAAPAPVVVMSGVAHPVEVGACIAAGARGFLPKTLDSKVFSSALSVILNGGSYLPVEMHQALCPPSMSNAAPSPAPALALAPLSDAANDLDAAEGRGFTERERAVMAMVVEGLSNKEIARQLNLREVTIKVQLTRIYKKLGAKNRAQAATIMAQTNLLV